MGVTPRASVGVRPGRVALGGGVAFGHNPRVGIVIGARPFHHRHFFRPLYPSYPYAYGVYPYTLYPYYGYGLQSDFVYSGATPYPYPQASYMPEHDTGLQNEVYRLQAELDAIRQQQALDRRYAAPAPAQPEPAAAPAKPAPTTVLVYRDGRKTEVGNYAVVGQTLWIFSEARARKVPLAELDLNATRTANEERGVEFSFHAPAPAPDR
jgi:hypothetical protein